MLFGTGIELGIGIVAHPDKDEAIITNTIKILTLLALFFNFKLSASHINDLTIYKGFRQHPPAVF